MKRITFVLCLLAVLFANAQYTGPGYYRVHNVGSDRYLSIKGTHYNKSPRPDAFWPCVKMEYAPDQVSDVGTIIYIPDTAEYNLYGQGVSTYSLTHLPLQVALAKKNEGGIETYIAKTYYNGVPTIFRDYGVGFTAGTIEKPECRWWIEPVNEESIETSFLGLKPVNYANKDNDIEHWTSLCCDFPCLIPRGGGIEGAYTVNDIIIDQDNIARVKPMKICGQGDTIPAATPVLIRCKSTEVEGNKLMPVGDVANHTEMPITANLLMGNYFSIFSNHCDYDDYSIMTDYLPAQSTPACGNYLMLGIDEDGTLGFFPKEEGTYMDANTAWIDITSLDLQGVTAIYFITNGDANGDNRTDMTDLSILINYLLTDDGGSYRAPFNLYGMDMNNNGVVDMSDLSLLINYLLTN